MCPCSHEYIEMMFYKKFMYGVFCLPSVMLPINLSRFGAVCTRSDCKFWHKGQELLKEPALDVGDQG